jgi:excisionase family DNA binding protein
MEHLMTSEEIAEYLHVDPVTIRRLVGKGELAAYRIGADYRFAPSDVEAYLQRQRIAGGEEFSDNPFDESDDAPSYLKWIKLPFGIFSEQAKRVLKEAQGEAQRFQHSYIGTEHLLLGILDAGESAATQMLRNLEVQPDQLREMVASIIGKSKNGLTGEFGLTPRAKKALMLALEEMKRFHQRAVGPEHLLLALSHPGTGIAADVLEHLGADVKHMYMQMKRVLGEQQKVPLSPQVPKEPPPPVPEQASALLAEDAEGRTCKRCGARSPAYFRYCFNCGAPLGGE